MFQDNPVISRLEQYSIIPQPTRNGGGKDASNFEVKKTVYINSILSM